MPAQKQLVTNDPEVLGGTPVFSGTRVPVRTLLDYLAAGDTVATFLDHFPTVASEFDATDLVRFTKKFTGGTGDYTAVRDKLFEGISFDQVVAEIKNGINE